MSEIIHAGTLIVGAGPAGLAVGACLRRLDLPFMILEQGDRVGAKWSQHYDRLHFNTDSRHSGLPYWPWPKGSPRYPSRQEMLDYLEGYAARFRLEPQFGRRVCAAERLGDGWLLQTDRPDNETYEARNLVIATGLNRVPHRPTWTGQEGYRGEVLHSAEYRNGFPFQGQRVLVVGFGNSGAEIAVDLYEHGALPTLAARSHARIVPREILGVPLVYFAVPMRALSDRIGQTKKPKLPVIDLGIRRLVREGKVTVRPGIACFTQNGVQFANGAAEEFDAIILATGYRTGVTDFLHGAEAAFDEAGLPHICGHESAVPGLFFCGLSIPPTGLLREIGIEAPKIANAIAGQADGAGQVLLTFAAR